MKDYLDYPVDKVNDFLELYKRMQSFSSEIAFVKEDNSFTYKQLLTDIRKVSRIFEKNKQFILLNIKDKYLFTIAFFATVLSGNIACLQPFSPGIYVCFQKYSFYISFSDESVLDIIKGEDVMLNYHANDGIATVLCSSGTTSTPKAVALTQKSIISDMVAGMEKYIFEKNGRYVSVLPYTHAFGLTCDLLAPLYSASTIFPVYDVISFFGALIKFNPTALNITPGIVEALATRIATVGNSESVVGTNLKKVLSGGAGTSANVCSIMRKYGIGVYGCYGLSECSPCVCVNRDNYYKDGSAGIMLNCNVVSIEPSGQIKINGSNVMAGYLDENGSVIEDTKQEYVSSDIGYIDSDGFLYVQGRIDDLIVFLDGTKVMPQIIENEISKIDGVKESIVFAEGDKLSIIVVIDNMEQQERIEKEIALGIYSGFKLSQITISKKPLEKNSLGKLNRRCYGQKGNY